MLETNSKELICTANNSRDETMWLIISFCNLIDDATYVSLTSYQLYRLSVRRIGREEQGRVSSWILDQAPRGWQYRGRVKASGAIARDVSESR
jgi:hypothetical protein